MRRTRYIVLPVKSWQYMGLMVVSLACLTLGLVSRDRGGRSESLAGPELQHTAPHEVDACPNLHPFCWVSRYDETALEKGPNDYSGDTRALVSVNTLGEPIAEEQPENIGSKLDKERSAIRNRRSIAIDRRIRTIDTSRLRKDNAERLRSEPSRIREVRRNLSSLHGKRNGIDTHRSDKSDYRARQSNRRLEPLFVRSSGSRSQELRGEPNSMVLGRKTKDPNYRSSYNDQRNREAADFRSARSRKQRLNSPSHDYRSNERRDNRVTRNLSNDRKSLERRFSVSDRTDRSDSVLRRVVRSVNRGDRRDDQSSRISRSWNARMEQRTEDRRSSRTHRQSDFIMKRTDASSLAMRQINQHERRERFIADRSSKPNSGIARTRSADSYRANDDRVEILSQNRRFVEQLKKDSRLHKKAPRDSSRSHDSRQSSHRNMDRSDIGGKRVRSLDQNSFERRTMNPIQYRTMRIDHLARSRDGQRRIAAQSDLALAERRVRIIDRSERRHNQERRGRLTDRLQTRQSMRENEPNRRERRQGPLSARSEERRSSGSQVREPMTRLDSLRRVAMFVRSSRARGIPVRSESSATRSVSRDRQTSTVHLGQRRASSFDLSRLSLGSTSNVVDSQRRERFALSDSSRGTHPGQAKQFSPRKLRTSNNGHRTSATIQARRVSGTDSVERRSRSNSRNSRTRDAESFESVARRDATDQRAVTRFGNSQERRAASATRELGRTSARISLYQNGRISGKSRLTRERRHLSEQRPVTREIQTANARRELIATRLERGQTTGVVSWRRDSRGSKTSKNADAKLHERFAASPVLHERRSRSAAITRDLGEPRAQNGAGTHRKDRNTIDNGIRLARNENSRRIFEKRSLPKSLTSVPDLKSIEKISKTNEYAHQILLLVLSAIYGASLLKGKDGFHSFRNIISPSSRLVVW